mmetsp:Transcript_149009/g.415231  ORF Transcript_149009/g.415231 Transcript_149009/m.415231 type:complete len:309 (-) Transcript_149009:319-1245(-)|eukprot:CAMPEP_0179201450 /NCGR_PEP_ID=MMETSP0796-20121207/100259_1 /TAXON_ID=73915 /ORGANISM="Pyrodinium bahamense, Strain pbaha01" /LENGTH=308 /DNA_ID=CAMNT_0020906007 /DNA_START=111 /DNA_END=1037 /DNA_ORIENTATION=+
MTTCEYLADYMEAIARRQKAEPPTGYGYKADVAMGVGFFREEKTGCNVLEKPVVIPSGKPEYQGYVIVFAYSSEEGVKSLLEGQLPPMLPATKKEPKEFATKAAIADNFGNKDAEASVKKGTSDFCVALRVPSELASKVDTPGRDLWIVRFDQDVISPFLQAAKECDLPMVTKGLESGISGGTVDEDGVSALMMAATKGSLEACQVLIAHSADVNGAEPINCRTPLMFAAQGGFTDVVELLIGKKADPSKVDSEGATALMWAATANRAPTAKVLASFGFTDMTNQEGQTALAIAEKMNHASTIAVLKA